MNLTQRTNFRLIEQVAACRSNRLAISGFRDVASNEVLISNLNTVKSITVKPTDRETVKRHERRRERVKKIYDAALHKVLDRAKRESLNRLAGLYATAANEAANATTPVAADFMFSADEFSESFFGEMRQAGRDAFKVSARGLVGSELRGKRITARGLGAEFLIKRENLLKDVPDEIYQDIAGRLEAAAAGEGEAGLADAIRSAFDQTYEGRAETVARTETASVYGAASQAAVEADYAFKRWLSASDADVRDSHAAVNGEVVPVDEVFSNGLAYPGDPSGPPEEVINCRCVLVGEDAP